MRQAKATFNVIINAKPVNAPIVAIFYQLSFENCMSFVKPKDKIKMS